MTEALCAEFTVKVNISWKERILEILETKFGKNEPAALQVASKVRRQHPGVEEGRVGTNHDALEGRVGCWW